MSRQLHTLTDLQLRTWVKQATPIAGASDGGGLTFTLSKAGTASWTLRYRFGGKRKELTLGNYPDITLGEARRLAGENRALVDKGIDPGAAKAARKKADAVQVWTVKTLAEDYRSKRLVPALYSQSTLYARTLDLDNTIIPLLGKQPVAEVKGKDIVQMLRDSEKDWTVAKRVLTTATKMFEHAAGLHLVDINPCVGVSLTSIMGARPPVKPRVMLTKDELRTLLANLDTLGPANALAFQILLHTCVRTSELVATKWEHVDLENASWYVPDANTKTRAGFYTPLMPAVVGWFRELKLLAGSSPFVLPARVDRKAGEPITSRTLWAAFDRAFSTGRLSVTKFTPHDCRSTAKGHMRELGISHFDSERALNHAIPGMGGIYDVRTDLAEKREALRKWSDFLLSLSTTPANQVATDTHSQAA